MEKGGGVQPTFSFETNTAKYPPLKRTRKLQRQNQNIKKTHS